MIKSFLSKPEVEFWNERYRKKKKYYGEHPSWLAVNSITYFKKRRVKRVLELACGQGRDAFFFAEKGFFVVATDASLVAIDDIKDEAVKRGLQKKIKAEVLDVRKDFPYQELSFDACFSNLGLHYFSEEETRDIFTKIADVLRPKSPFIFSVSCTHDAYYGKGRKLAPNYFEKEGRKRYFFSEEAIHRFCKTYFKIERLEEKEEVVDRFLNRVQSYFAVFAFKRS